MIFFSNRSLKIDLLQISYKLQTMKKCLKNDLHLLENYDYNMLCIYFISIKYKKLKFIYIQILFVFHEIKNYILVIEPSFLNFVCCC